MEDMSPQRKNAYMKWRQAQQEAQKHHYEKAVELAKLGLDEDETYLELRFWLAELYHQNGDVRKASRILEDIILQNREDQAAWKLIREVDPAAATRLERLQEIAPDPFVAQRNSHLTDDLVDDEDDMVGPLDEDQEFFGYENKTNEIPDDPFVSNADMSLFVDAGDENHHDTVPVSAAAVSAASHVEPTQSVQQPADRGGYGWEYEQDRPYLHKWHDEPVVTNMTIRLQKLWEDRDAWEPVLSICAHSDKHLHPAIHEAAAKASEKLGVAPPELFVFPERCMHPVIIKDRNPMLAVPTGLIRVMKPQEILFQIGREIGHIHTGYVAEMQIVKIITNRKTALIGDLAATLRDFMADHMKYWDDGLKKEDLERLKKLGHAWQQRCELSADRAGLICCGDIDAACNALAKTCARTCDEAEVANCKKFLQQFEGEDIGALAAIPVEETPSRSPRYVAYRIHMLRWWATTPAYRALAGI